MAINVTVKTVPHPNPAQAIDVFARIIVKEILAQEKEANEKNEPTPNTHTDP